MIKIVKLEIYRVSVIFLVEVDKKEIDLFYYENHIRMTDKERDYLYDDLENESNGGSAILTDEGSVIVHIKDGDDINTIAHEIFHAANFVLTRAGVKHEGTAEAWAYLIGHLTECYYNWMKDEGRLKIVTNERQKLENRKTRRVQ